MSLRSFLNDLREDGRVKVAPPGAPAEADRAAGEETLRDIDRQVRLEMAFEAPPYRCGPALWAATKLYRVCQLFVFPNTSPDAIRESLGDPCPEPISPAVVYSVDLTFRFLPDVVTLVRAAADRDALIRELMALAMAWPLSSVRIQGVADV